MVDHGQDAYLCSDKTASALAAGLHHYLDLTDDKLLLAGHAAASSLAALGCDEASFRARWLRVLTDTMPS